MEQKRALWIIAAVGIFLLVVLGAALLLYSPSAKSENNIALVPAIEKKSNDAWESPLRENKAESETEFANKNDNTKESETSNKSGNDTQVQDMTVFSENTIVYENKKRKDENELADANNETLIDLNEIGKQKTESEIAVTPANAQSEEKIANVKKTVFAPPAAEFSPMQSERVKPAEKNMPSAKVQEPNRLQTQTAKVPQGRTGEIRRTKNAVSKTMSTAVLKKTQYWVQAASYTNKNGADSARNLLDSNKIVADVFTHQDSHGTIFYRVRIGPYTTESEAEYWKNKVAEIAQFKTNNAYVTKTTIAVN